MLTEFSIDRALWGSGQLRNPTTGKMCCLGHMSRACGVSDEMMGEWAYPRSNWGVPEAFKCWSTYGECGAGLSMNDAGMINDSSMPWEDKEPLLIKLFADHGITLSFYGEMT